MTTAYPTIDAPLLHDREGADWGVDPVSGARVVRLTSSAGMSHNIYCEQPYTSPDGRRVLIGRWFDPFAPTRQLLVADLRTLGITQVEPDLPGEIVAHSAWGEWVHYVMHDGSVRRLSLMTLERQAVLAAGSFRIPPHACLCTATPDGAWLIGYEPNETGTLTTFAHHVATGERRVIADGPDNVNPHVQADLSGRPRVLHQLIRQEGGRRILVVIHDFENDESTTLPIGGEHTAESSGHMAWIGDTGRVACAVDWLRDDRRQDPRHREGNLVLAAPGDTEPTVIGAPGHGFYHVSVSRCGRYFVCDDFMDIGFDGFGGGAGPQRIVVGSIATGRTRVLIADCQNHGIAGSSRYEPDPYFTADNGHVIYNASPFGLMQVFAAAVPPGFLAALD